MSGPIGWGVLITVIVIGLVVYYVNNQEQINGNAQAIGNSAGRGLNAVLTDDCLANGGGTRPPGTQQGNPPVLNSGGEALR